MTSCMHGNILTDEDHGDFMVVISPDIFTVRNICSTYSIRNDRGAMEIMQWKISVIFNVQTDNVI